MGSYQNVLKPLKVRNLTFKNRIQFSPMVCCLSNAEGEVTDEYIQFVGNQARTGVSYITIGDTQVDNERGTCFYGELDVTHDKYIAGLSQLADEVHRYGAKLSIELSHAGRGASATKNTKRAFAPSPLPIPGCWQDLKVMDREDMDLVIKQFAECSVRVQKAGFDMIMIHSGHNNLLGQFLSPQSNIRTDEYGGSLENRMRFPLEILKGVREAVGDKMVIEMRVSGDEMTTNGLGIEECLDYVKEAQKYIDIVHFSGGNVFMAEGMKYSIPTYLQEHKQNVKYAREAKKVLDIPVVAVGNIYTLQDAEDILADGEADIIAMCRSLLADPQLIRKAVRGEEATIRPCLRCMDGCVSTTFEGLPVRCAVNPVNGREYHYRTIPMAKKPKKVMVIGGGPAGMMATQTLVQRGHHVTLYEKSDKLGGLLHDASAVEFKDLMKKYTEWDIRTTMECGAKIKLNTEVTPELIKEEMPDEIIVATGSTFLKPSIPGIDGPNVKMLRDVEVNDEPVGNKVIVCGGGLSGVECAIALAKQGKDVTVVDMIPEEEFCQDSFLFTRLSLFDEVKDNNVKFLGNSRIERFLDNGLEVTNQEGNLTTLEADHCIIALGLKPENGLATQLVQEQPFNTYIVGDCDQVATIRKANTDAFNVAVEI